MKRPLYLSLIVTIAALPGDLSGSLVPDRKPISEKDVPEPFTNSIGMKFVWIPHGSFVMGSPNGEKARRGDELQHKVRLTKGFYMGVHLVTQEEWQSVMGDNPSHFKGEKNLPVEQVSWEDCQEFVKKLRDKESKPYRLPTEAEWEYACRAGTTTPIYFGETISTDQANYHGDFIYGNGKKGLNRQKTTPVNHFPPNAWGLCDMNGNVCQWCKDRYGNYPQKDVVDPQGETTKTARVFRGSAFYLCPDYCRSASRGSYEPALCFSYVGLRLCFFVE